MLATLVFFAVRLSRVDSIEMRDTVRDRRSTKARPVPRPTAGGGRAGGGVPAARLDLPRWCLFCDRLPCECPRKRLASRLPDTGFRGRIRVRLLGGERAGKVSAIGVCCRGSYGPECTVAAVAVWTEAQPSVFRLWGAAVRAECGQGTGTPRGHRHCGWDGRHDPNRRPAGLVARSHRRRP